MKNVLETQKFENLQKKHVTLSNEIFQAFLYEKYQGKTNDFEYFSYKQHIYEFIDSFPVILSTTYSLRNCIPKNFLFDYVIIDESSQVDLLAGSLALSAAKNAVIVGDTKQLPQIVDKKIKKELSYSNVEICYDYFKQNLLSSFFSLYPDILSVTLKEHYRCYSKIIEFCNQRYYDGQLIPFFDEKNHQNIKKPLIIYHCAPGNHMKQKKLKNKCDNYNEQEMEVIKEEVLKSGIVEEYQDEDIGITTPYRFQADEISKALEEAMESDTIHKFQGREKKLMILSTVIDSSYYGKKNIHFVDDPCMLNVAVSRAIRQFMLVTDHDLFKKMGTEVKALLKYMKYHTMDSEIIESNLISVFDLLYQNYHDSLNDLSKRLLNRYRYKSENIMDAILTKELQKEEYKDYSYTGQIFLKEIFRENDKFIEEERNFIRNNSSFDFVVYHVLDKQPVLFIEVDGFYYHKNNKNQQRRDRLKDSIAKKCQIPLLRFETQKYYKEENIIAAVRNILLKE